MADYCIPHLLLDFAEMQIGRKIGEGLTSNVFKAKLPSFQHGRSVALKIFKEYQPTNKYYVRAKGGGQLSYFERELRAITVVQGDQEAALDSPVVECYGWFELPPNYSCGNIQLSRQVPLKVLVKELVTGPAFDFDLVSPQRMANHRETLNRLEVYDKDIRLENFKGGKLVDLSNCYVLNQVDYRQKKGVYDLADQWPQVQRQALLALGYISLTTHVPFEEVKKTWEALEQTFA